MNLFEVYSRYGNILFEEKKKWDYKSVKEEASKYKSRKEFWKGSNSAYDVARKNGWLDEWFGHLYKSWDYDSVKEESSKYKSRTEFAKGNESAYRVALKNGWLDEFFSGKNNLQSSI